MVVVLQFFFSDIYIFVWQISIIIIVCLLVFVGVQYLSTRKEKIVVKNKLFRNLKSACSQMLLAVPVPVCIVNLNGVIEDFNSEFSKLIDLESSALMGVKFSDLLKGNLRDDFLDVLNIHQHISVTFNDYYIRNSVQYRVRSHFISNNDDSAVYRMISFEPLIKRYSRDEASLVRPILEQLIVETNVAIVLINRSGKVLMANEKACSLYGGGIDSFKGKTIGELLPNEFQDEISEDYNEIFNGNKLVFRGVMSKTSGKLLPVSVSVINVTVEGEVETILFIDDVSSLVTSEYKLKEAQLRVEQSDKLKSSFLANISHEIRTPLNAILGFSDLINDPSISENDKMGFIKQIKQSGESLLELIGGIIKFSRISAGDLKIQSQKVDLDELFLHLQRHAVKVNKLKNRPLDIKIGLNDYTKSIELYTDYDNVLMALKNLVDNAVKFTFSGNVEFGVIKKGESFVQFYVNDSGIGISLENLKLVFERFVQGDLTNTREFGGTGIGLTVSAELIRLMGGFLWIKSTVGVGSSFNVVLPKCPLKNKDDDDIAYKDRSSSNKAMLVLDAKEDSYIDLIKVTSCEVQQTFWAQTVPELVNILQSNTIDVVFVNCKNVAGIDALEWVVGEYKLETKFLGFNTAGLTIDGMDELNNYPFVEKEMLSIYNNYLPMESTSSNSISI